MDAIRKKMQSLKSETDSLYATIARFEDETKEANALSDKYECDIRDVGKKTQSYEVEFDETMDKLTKALANLEEREKAFKSAEEDVSALTRYLKKLISNPNLVKSFGHWENYSLCVQGVQ